MRLQAILSWAMYQWETQGRVILRMDHDLATALLNTRMEDTPVETLPELPFDGFYIHCPNVFRVYNRQTGIHKGEGIYVFRDSILPYAGADKMVPALGFLAIGEDLSRQSTLPGNDAVIYSFLIAGKCVDDPMLGGLEGIREAIHIAMNFLLLFNSEEALSILAVKPPVPKSPKKLKRIERRGLSTHKYFDVTLKNKKPWGERVDRQHQPQDWDGPWHVATVPGFFRRYWYKYPPEGVHVIATKTKDNALWFCTRKFIAPHEAWRRGQARDVNTYIVR